MSEPLTPARGTLRGPILRGPPASTLDERLADANWAGVGAGAFVGLLVGLALGALACWHVAGLLGWMRP